ncbi:MAG: FG-GAP repeat protein [Cyanobacteria bacterium P01_E01_bin.42]
MSLLRQSDCSNSEGVLTYPNQKIILSANILKPKYSSKGLLKTMFRKSFLYFASTAIAFLVLSPPSSANTLKLTAPDAERGDFFGESVAIDGNYALVGTPADDLFDKGSAYLFDTTTGNLLHQLIAPDGAEGDYFGESVAIDGNYALVGAWRDDDNSRGEDSGSAYLFDITTGDFLYKLTAPDGRRSGAFGQSLAIDGNYILIGANRDMDSGSVTGSSYLFDTTTGNFIRKLVPPNRKSGSQFGRSLAMDGDYALIGAFGDYDSSNDREMGFTYLFDVTTGNLLHRLAAPDGVMNDNFGVSVAIDGDYTLIGAWGDDDNGEDSGSAYLFDTTTGNFLHKLTAPDGERWDNFGGSVAIDGNYALIGTHRTSGSAYLFDTTTGNFLQTLTAPDGANLEDFGRSLTIDGDSALIGARYDDDNGWASGAAYLFGLNPQTNPNPVPEPASLLGLLAIGVATVTGLKKGKSE